MGETMAEALKWIKGNIEEIESSNWVRDSQLEFDPKRHILLVEKLSLPLQGMYAYMVVHQEKARLLTMEVDERKKLTEKEIAAWDVMDAKARLAVFCFWESVKERYGLRGASHHFSVVKGYGVVAPKGDASPGEEAFIALRQIGNN